MYRLLASCALLLSANAAAVDLLLGAGTYHFSEYPGTNNDNQLVAIAGERYHCATFVNSLHNRTHACGIHNTRKLGDIEFSVLYGVMRGYTSEDFKGYLPCANDICPYLAFKASYSITDVIAIEGLLFGKAVLYSVRLRF